MVPLASVVLRLGQHAAQGALDRRNPQAEACVHSAREIHVRAVGVAKYAVRRAPGRAIRQCSLTGEGEVGTTR